MSGSSAHTLIRFLMLFANPERGRNLFPIVDGTRRVFGVEMARLAYIDALVKEWIHATDQSYHFIPESTCGLSSVPHLKAASGPLRLCCAPQALGEVVSVEDDITPLFLITTLEISSFSV